MSRFKCSYDAVGDVLYTFIDKPEEAGAGSTDDSAGILYRVSKVTGKPCGVTVLDFKHTYALLGGDVLSLAIYKFLRVIPLQEVEGLIYSLLSYKDKNGFHNKI